jgi:hypothetical protein
MKNKRNFIAKDLYTPKYKNRVISMAKIYNRKKIKKFDLRNLDY